MSLEEIKLPLKRRKKNKFLRAFRHFFGCALKNVEGSKHKFISASCQCEIEKELDTNTNFEENNVIAESRERLETTEISPAPVSEDFRISLKKLDSLINSLNRIHSFYKTKQPLLQCYNAELEEFFRSDQENIDNKEYEDDVLKFNINFDENTSIECQTRKGKHSLTIVHSSSEQNFTPIILHRCESELLLTKKSCDNLGIKCSSEIFRDKSDQLQRSYHALAGRFGSQLYSLTSFKENLLDRMKNIKSDVNTLRNMLYYIEYVTSKNQCLLPLISFGEVRRWFYSETNYDYDQYSLKFPDFKYIKARTRATHFCRFYTMDKKFKDKDKNKIRNVKHK